MKKVFRLIEENVNKNDLYEEILKENINKYTIDFCSCLIQYIKTKIFDEYLKKSFEILEDNNIITTLLENKRNNFKYIDKNLIIEIIKQYLDTISIKNEREPKFKFNYIIPGFYNFYYQISDYIHKNIKVFYINNEKKLRESSIKKNEFDEKDQELFSIVFVKFSTVDKFVNDFIDRIQEDIIIKDYITYYLQKYKIEDFLNNIDDFYYKTIEILLKLKFNEETNIIKENKNNISKIVCAKILWIESNIEQILSIIKILEYSNTIFKDKKDKLIQNIEKLIFKDDKEKDFMSEIKLSINIKEINKCYCILLKSIIFFIISDEIELKEKNMEQFCKILKEINSILQNLNNNLNLDLKEIYIIDELIQIIEIFLKNKNINIKLVIEIKNILRENNLIIQNYINKDIDNSLIEKIIRKKR